mmetsp:Transcript_31951/g.93954  ORF Transcript_31951/g.93954 Transcript_31951/m.93954 type:complete len:756 (+) Transcript_31951:1-2268(+)
MPLGPFALKARQSITHAEPTPRPSALATRATTAESFLSNDSFGADNEADTGGEGCEEGGAEIDEDADVVGDDDDDDEEEGGGHDHAVTPPTLQYYPSNAEDAGLHLSGGDGLGATERERERLHATQIEDGEGPIGEGAATNESILASGMLRPPDLTSDVIVEEGEEDQEQPPQQQQQQTQTMKTKAPTDDTSSNTIANLREEIDCLRAKVKARDVAIVGLRGEVSEAKADLKHVRLVLQKEQRRNGDIGSGGTGSSAGAGDTTNNNSEGANGSTAPSGHSEWISSYSYSATTATSADVETTAPTASTAAAAAADVAMYQRQIQRQQEEIRSRDVRLNWMQRKMESLEVERGSLLEQVAEAEAVPATSGTSSTVPAGGENAARGDDEEDLLNRSESSQPGRIATASSKMDEAVALRLKLHKSDSTVAALKAEINTIRSPELYASSQAAELERLVQKTKRDAAAIAALKSENSRLVMETASGKSVRDEDTDQVVAHGGANKPIDEILGEVSRCVDSGEIYGDGPEDEFFGDSLVEDPTIRSMSTPPADKVKIKALEKKLCEAKELEISMRSRLGVLTAALNGESSKVSAEKVISEQKEAEFEGNLDQLAAANDEQVALIARMEQDIDDREKSLEVLRAIIDSQKKEIKMQRGNAERWKEGERALEEENKELKRTLKKAAKVVKNAASNNDQADLDATTDVTMETEASPNVSQEGVEIMEDAFSRVAFSVTKAQDTISQWMEKLPQCVPDDAASFVTK